MTFSAVPAAQGLYDPANEHDACGVAFVVDARGRRSHRIVEQGLTALRNMEHRGAAGSEANSGDGAGILIQVPDAFLRAVVDFALPEPTADGEPTYAVGNAFLPGRPGRAGPRGRGHRADRGRGGRHRPRLAGRAHRRGRRRPRPHRALRGAARRAALPRRRARPGARAQGVRGPQAGRAGDQRARHHRLLPVAVGADHGLQGHAHPRPAAAVLPRPRRRAAGQRDRARAHPVLHQHVPVLAAGPPVPVHRAQRRDQHDPGQPELDARPRGAAAQRR